MSLVGYRLRLVDAHIDWVNGYNHHDLGGPMIPSRLTDKEYTRTVMVERLLTKRLEKDGLWNRDMETELSDEDKEVYLNFCLQKCLNENGQLEC